MKAKVLLVKYNSLIIDGEEVHSWGIVGLFETKEGAEQCLDDMQTKDIVSCSRKNKGGYLLIPAFYYEIV